MGKYTREDLRDAEDRRRGYGYNQPKLTIEQVADISMSCLVGKDSDREITRDYLLRLATEDKPKAPAKKVWGWDEAKVVEDRTGWQVGDVLRCIHADRYEHQGPNYFKDGDDYIIVGIYKDNGVSDVRVVLYNGDGHDNRVKSGSRQQFKLHRKADWNKDGWLLSEHGAERPKPAYLPIKRKVRWDDLEDGCVLRYCGNELFKDLEDRGMLVVGDLYTIRKDGRGALIPYTTPNTSITGVKEGYWAGISGRDPWEFVSNPNYVHGFRIGERVYVSTERHSDWNAKDLIVHSKHPHSKDGVWCSHSGKGGANVWFYTADLTRDPTKAYGYKAPVEYKVKDGVAKEGDVIWWLASYGDPEKVIVEQSDNWGSHKNNVKAYPNAYQLREPQKVWDYKVK